MSTENSGSSAPPAPGIGGKVVELLGFDPNKQEKSTAIFDKVIQKVQAKRAADAEAKVEILVTELIDLTQQKNKAVQEFQKKEKEFDKKINNLMGRLQAISKGQEPPAEEKQQPENIST